MKQLADILIVAGVVMLLGALLMAYFAFCEKVITWFCKKTKDKKEDKQ